MKIKVSSGGDFQPLEGGSYIAICNAVIDLGLQPGSTQYPDPKQQILLNFELPTELTEFDGESKPRNISRRFTASMHEKAALRNFVESFFGKPFPNNGAASDFDLKNLLGRRGMLIVQQVSRGNKTYANITGASPVPKGMTADQPQVFENFYYSLEAPDLETYNKFPQWLQDVIANRVQVDTSRPASNVPDSFADDDIPF